MSKFIPWLFLIPVLALLAGLPSQLRGDLPYHVSTVSYILSIFGWLFIFCGIFALSHASKFTRLFFALFGLVVIADTGYCFWAGQRGVAHFIFDFILIWVAIAMMRSFPSARHDNAT
jgi:hypothetical protein